jgi:hypothetical protein
VAAVECGDERKDGEPIAMEETNTIAIGRKQLLHALVRNMLVKGREFGHPILLHIPAEEIPDTPLEEFEIGIEEFFEQK